MSRVHKYSLTYNRAMYARRSFKMWNLVKGLMVAGAAWNAVLSIFMAKKRGGAMGAAKMVALEVVSLSLVGVMLFAGAIGAAVSAPWWLIVALAVAGNYLVGSAIDKVRAGMRAA